MLLRLVFFTFLLSSSTLFALSNAASSNTYRVENLNFNQLQQSRRAYLIFLKRVEKDKQTISPVYKGEKFTAINEFQKYFDYIMSSAYAKSGDLCFFGGWPSRMDGPLCQTPWNVGEDAELKKFGSYSKESACGSPGEFRCNPALFGKPSKELIKNKVSVVNGITYNRKPYLNGNDKGFCIKTDYTWKNLTQKCEEISKQNISGLIEDYQKNPDLLQNFHDSILGPTGFCDKYETNKGSAYDACDDLEKRLNAIGSGRDAKRDTSTPMVVNQLQPDVNYAKNIFDSCQKYLDSNKYISDVENRNILSVMSYGEDSCDRKLSKESKPSYTEVLMMAKDLDPLHFLSKLNLKKYEANIKALMVNEIAFLGDESLIPVNDKEKFKSYLSKKFPHLDSEQFNSIYEKSFDDIQKYKNEGIVKKTDHVTTLGNLNSKSSEVQKICNELNSDYNKKFGKEGMLEKLVPWNEEERSFFKQNEWRVKTKLKSLLNTPNAGHLFGTKEFREHVFDPGQDLIENCVKDKDYQIVKSPIKLANYLNGIKDVRRELLSDLKSVNKSEDDILKGNMSVVKDQIKDYVAGDKSLLLQTLMSNQDEQLQKRMGSYICRETIQLYNSDRFRVGLGHLSLATAVLGSVLAFTPLAPVGIALMAVGGAGEVGVGISHIRESNKARDVIGSSFSRGTSSTQDFITDSKAAEKQSSTGKKYVVSGLTSASSLTTRAGVAVYKGVKGSRGIIGTSGQASVAVKPALTSTPFYKLPFTRKGVPSVQPSAQPASVIILPSAKATVDSTKSAGRAKASVSGIKPKVSPRSVAHYMKELKVKVVPSSLVDPKKIAQMTKKSALEKLKLILGSKKLPTKTEIRSLMYRFHPDRAPFKNTEADFGVISLLYRRAFPKGSKK